MKFEWETIHHNHVDDKHFTYTDRAKVFGGWVVNSRTCAGNKAHESMVFVPDEFHDWTIEK